MSFNSFKSFVSVARNLCALVLGLDVDCVPTAETVYQLEQLVPHSLEEQLVGALTDEYDEYYGEGGDYDGEYYCTDEDTTPEHTYTVLRAYPVVDGVVVVEGVPYYTCCSVMHYQVFHDTELGSYYEPVCGRLGTDENLSVYYQGGVYTVVDGHLWVTTTVDPTTPLGRLQSATVRSELENLL